MGRTQCVAPFLLQAIMPVLYIVFLTDKQTSAVPVLQTVDYYVD